MLHKHGAGAPTPESWTVLWMTPYVSSLDVSAPHRQISFRSLQGLHLQGYAERISITNKLTNKSLVNDGHPLHRIPTRPQDVGRQRLRSRRPFSRHAATLSSSNFNLIQEWDKSWEGTARPHQFTIPPDTKAPAGSELPRRDWVTLNRLRTGVGRFNANMHRWGLSQSPACICGADEQTADHVIYNCPVLQPPDGMTDLTSPNDAQANWLSRLQEIAWYYCLIRKKKKIQ